jgi:beta-glucosidase-like glycosyl hydrolase/CubicO group peptidase (beta-lactamase class C family)
MTKTGFSLLAVLLFGFLMCQSDLPAGNAAANAMDEDKKQAEDSARIAQAAMDKWVEAKMAEMNDEQRLGQLFMLGAYPQKGAEDELRIAQMIATYHIGGLIYFKGSPTRLAALNNKYQGLSRLPLLIGIDGEWGVSMRLDSAIRFPRQLTLGAIRDNKTVYNFGRFVAKECKRLGIHINFAPVVDVNNNPANPVIGDRSFGEDMKNVALKAEAYMLGMQDNQVLACAKHFPGHGDTDVDSHYDLPKLMQSRQRLDSLELYPFRYLIEKGVASIMVAHLEIPALDSTPNLPATLSPLVVKKLMKEEMGFEGLAITDALNMAGVTKHHALGESDLKALLAGNDILLMTQDMAAARKKILQAIKDGRLTWDDLNARVRRVLRAKYRAGLHNYKPLDLKNVVADIATAEGEALREEIYAKSLTLVANNDNLLPIAPANAAKVATIAIGSATKTSFQTELDRFGINNHFQAGHSIVGKQADKYASLKKYDAVIVSLYNIGKLPKDGYNISPSAIEFVKELNKSTKVILVAFGNPYSIQYFDSLSTVAVAYDDERQIQQLMAQAVVGALPIDGVLPINTARFKCGTGVITKATRMSFATRPEVVGLSSSKLNKIDAIAKEMIAQKAAPGCQVLVVKNGKIAFHKAYGHHTYDKTQTVKLNDVYDLASVTKIAATTISLMKLYEEGQLNLDKTLGDYLPQLKGSNKESLLIREVLTHNSGLTAWIPFYKNTLDSLKKPQTKYYKNKTEGDYCVRVSPNLYFCKTATDSVIWHRIHDAPQESKTYRYSDLGFILFTNLVQNLSQKPLDQYAYDNFYAPMGLTEINYNPTDHNIKRSRIIPTEKDDYFRHQVVQGDVHDMAAAMIGGVSGHAGLFSTATDLAAVFQMLINDGDYMGKQYLEPTTVQLFTAQQNTNSRRALGFDRKENGSDKKSVNVAYQASERTFGHLGFTGIGAWADPDEQIIYIFLSNRTYPTGENNKLNSLGIRTRIHEAIYDARIK